ncbi:MAG: single-stranded DNA-binding protein, partial [Deltaproteobacteria bacterium]|nr:single-stranded DNA-binding protein [Deltaproteobacteria bacterium]
QTRSWEDRDGNKRYTTEIVANQMQMLGNKGDSPQSASSGGSGGSGGRPSSAEEPPVPDMEDIPF